MRRSLIFVAAMLLASGAARAADAPVFAPAPSWVKPIQPAAAGAPSEAAVELLLLDQQVMLEPGREAVYNSSSVRLQTPQGLAVGNISLAWRPETDTLTVHKLVIRRGDKVIDVIGEGGQTFTVLRREPNLESAMLDGVMTANIQPEGLQVGDILEIATTLVSSDPVMKGHIEHIGGGWDALPVGRAHLRVEWPSSVKLRVRGSGGLAPLKPVSAGGRTYVEVSADGVEPLSLPAGAPDRYRMGRLAEFTDFPSWSGLATLMAPLYAKAAAIPPDGPLAAEVARIAKASSDPRRRTEAALALVQDRIRYVALAMGDGGYVPADAAATWSRRYGDCKAKTALLLAMLHALGVEASPVAVSTIFGDGLDERLPLVGLLNHVLVRATIAGRTYWLDGTRTGDTALDRIETPMFSWGVPLTARPEPLVRMIPPPREKPDEESLLHIDASAGVGVPAPARAEVIMRGDAALGAKVALANLSGAARDRALRDYWRERLDFVDIKTADARFDDSSGEMRVVMTGEARMDWNGGYYHTTRTGVGYRADFTRPAGPGHDAPFAVAYPFYNRVEESIILPPGVTTGQPAAQTDVDETVAGIAYQRRTTIDGNLFKVVTTSRSVTPEISFAAATAAQARLRELAAQSVSLRALANYRPSPRDDEKIASEPASRPSGHVVRAHALMRLGRLDEARDAINTAVKLAPDDVVILNARALFEIQLGDLAAAARDLDRIEKIDPRSAAAARGRGFIALDEGDSAKALAAFDRAVELDPRHEDALAGRGHALANLERFEEAKDAYDAAIKLSPTDARLFGARAMAEMQLLDFAAATRDLDAAEKLDPRNAAISRGRGIVALGQGDAAKALAAFDKALELAPGDRDALAGRADTHYRLGNAKAALADSAAALKAGKRDPELNLLRANILRSTDREAALGEAKAAIAASPDDAYAYVIAASIYSRFDQNEEAMRAYDRALALKPEAYIYVNRAIRRPKEDRAGRRADLDAALKLEPTLAAALTAKAALLEETGDIAGARAAYDSAINADPDDLELRVTRAEYHARSGRTAEADADFLAARERAKTAVDLNNICWARATAGIGLAAALEDCNAALAKKADFGPYLDSRGLVLLRLGRLDAAIADYDRAIEKMPQSAGSLFGRGLAWKAKGDAAKARADFAAAEKLEADIAKEFEGYGLKR